MSTKMWHKALCLQPTLCLFSACFFLAWANTWGLKYPCNGIIRFAPKQSQVIVREIPMLICWNLRYCSKPKSGQLRADCAWPVPLTAGASFWHYVYYLQVLNGVEMYSLYVMGDTNLISFILQMHRNYSRNPIVSLLI